jgi:hypothetical protein
MLIVAIVTIVIYSMGDHIQSGTRDTIMVFMYLIAFIILMYCLYLYLQRSTQTKYQTTYRPINCLLDIFEVDDKDTSILKKI